MHVLDDAQLNALSPRPSPARAAVLLAIDHLDVLPLAHRVALLDEARGWLDDCGWSLAARPGVDEDLLVDVVERHYDGGWAAFVVNNAVLLDGGQASA